MKHLIKRHTISFQNAYHGLSWAFSTQPNYIVHLFLSIVTILAGFYFQITETEWLFVILTITLGLVIEALNTAIEATTDAIDLKIRNDIKIAKDVSAAAMLLYSIGAVIIAAIIFLPKIIIFY